MNLDQVLDRLDRPKKSAGGYLCRCPAHDDRLPSLSVALSESGAILMTCFAGCTIEDITAAIGIEVKDLFPDSRQSPEERKAYKRKKTRAEYQAQLAHELLVILQVLQTRFSSRELAEDDQYLRIHPVFKRFPEEYWERETLAAKRIVGALKVLYDV